MPQYDLDTHIIAWKAVKIKGFLFYTHFYIIFQKGLAIIWNLPNYTEIGS